MSTITMEPKPLPEAARRYRALMRRAEAKELAMALGVARRAFEGWCVQCPPLPEGMRLRHVPPGQTRYIYHRAAIVALATSIR